MDHERETPVDAPGGRPGIAVKIAIVVALALAVAIVVTVKRTPPPDAPAPAPDATPAPSPASLPRLVELGSDKCVPCRMMAPILDELRRDHAGVFAVDFIDVAKDPGAASNFGIRVIPTQVFLDPAGKELFRHEGFLPKEEILSKWRELGVK